MSADNSEHTKPLPRRRGFDLDTPVSIPSTPAPEQASFGQQAASARASIDGSTTPARTRSILDLASSTLFGIYRETDYATEREEPSTPWGTGAETPVDGRKGSIDLLRASIPEAFSQSSIDSRPKRKTPTTAPRRRPRARKTWSSLIASTVSLFTVGVLYGLLVSHLHNRKEINPVKVEGINHGAWEYLIFWGFAGVVLGHTLPAVDTFWSTPGNGKPESKRNSTTSAARGSGGWNDVVRSVGAFVGVAFAIRKLPWQSTLQLSLTLALANPAVWYLIDRSAPGLLVSTMVALSSTALLLGINPALVPPPSTAHMRAGQHNITSQVPAEHLVLGLFSEESVGVATWIASVIFVSAVCFGNIGRKLVADSR